MSKLAGIKLLFHDTFTKCLAFMHKDKPNKEYEQVETNSSKVKDGEHTDADADWSTQETADSNSDRNKTEDTPPRFEKKRKVLIGNIDEDNGVKKADAVVDADEDLFDDMEKPTFNQKIQTAGNQATKKTAAPKAQTSVVDNRKFSMDDELEAEEGWGTVDNNLEI